MNTTLPVGIKIYPPSFERPCRTRYHDLTAELSQNLPRFTVPADGILVLAQPSEFYSILLDMIRNAEKRIFISSLYIGSSEHELISTLKTRLTEKAGPSSTATILLPLLRHFPDRVHVSLFRSPSLRGIMAKIVPPRFNEGWGTWHAKIYGADDDLIISGANLNKAYFTNCRDRFLQEMSTFSYRLLPADSRQTTNPHSYTSGDYTKFMKVVRKTARNFARIGFLGQGNVELREWEKEGWTYHAKGLWLSPPADSAPVLTLFGSMNLNSRSADIDTELLFVMVLPPQEPCQYLGSGAGGVSGPGTGRRLAMKTGPKADVDVDGSNHGREVGNLDPIYNLRLQLARKVVKDLHFSSLKGQLGTFSYRFHYKTLCFIFVVRACLHSPVTVLLRTLLFI
ncbi:hypothetical protein D9757_014187 [Collybiopsis confluens]|uniref:CDP-diacylglycerol--glycerol-3-phosphate 3-phosphatidyltransferase n=1 Tax=Collybiopsis confluens TaxID=2823264 RepID=A0A8H5CR99_9AGAR|nr:hypothetical protein D9757_014187 [Collybiopsis confluens]